MAFVVKGPTHTQTAKEPGRLGQEESVGEGCVGGSGNVSKAKSETLKTLNPKPLTPRP